MRARFAAAAAAALVLGASARRGLAQDPLGDLDRAARALVEKCAPAVVRVEATRSLSLRPACGNDEERRTIEEALRKDPATETVSSSGFLVDASGLVLTTSAVSGKALSFRVTFPGGLDREGKLLGEDPLAGVALLQVEAVEGARALRFSEREAAPGTLTLLLAPQEAEGPALHFGFLTAARRAFGFYDAWLVSSVPLEAGHAGAPLLDAAGDVLGMAVAPRISVTFRSLGPAGAPSPVTPAGQGMDLQSIVEQSRTVESGPGFSTFVPAAELKRISADLRALGRVRRGLLGVQMPVDGKPEVRRVFADSPAAKAGFAVGDLILAIDGTPVRTAGQVGGFVQRRAPGTAVTVRLRAPGGPEREAAVVLGEYPIRKALFNGLGVKGRDSYDLAAAKFQAEAVEGGAYVVVETVVPDSAAARAGILPGDWIAASEDSVEILTYRAGEAQRRRVALK